MKNPCRLEIKDGGSWRLISKFDAADDDASSEVKDGAEHLIRALNAPEAGGKGRKWLRISIDDTSPIPLEYWNPERGMWTVAATGEPA